MGDALNTSVTVISTVQNSLISFSGQTFNILLIVGIAAQGVGIYAFWRVQHHWKLGTVTMLKIVCGFIVLLQVWGLIGIFTLRFGFHNVWEAYAYQAFYGTSQRRSELRPSADCLAGLFVCPWYAYSQTGISEVSPRGLEFQVFSLLNRQSPHSPRRSRLTSLLHSGGTHVELRRALRQQRAGGLWQPGACRDPEAQAARYDD